MSSTTQHDGGRPRGAARWLAVTALTAIAAIAGGCGEAEPLGGRAASLHPPGFADDHSAALRAAGWSPAPCFACHDDGDARPGDCRDCHQDGPDACDVCHREPDAAHRPHRAFDCVTCHPVPGERATPGHLEDRPDDVRFAGLARGPGHTPSYAAGRCSDTACHGGAGAASPDPIWGGRLPGDPCGACHGLPPPDHAAGPCDACHGPGIDGRGQIIEPALHLDGRLQLLDWRALPCDGCHGDGSAAPPPALDGGDDPMTRGVGAHRAHLAPTAAAPVACETCHIVPRRNDSPGHLDDGRPGAEVVFSPAAGPSAIYAAGGCADTACHGVDRPAWTGDAPCGTCHGLPPAEHPPGDCARCHPVAAPGGGIAAPERHVDGALDVALLSGADCDACHGPGGRVGVTGSHPTHQRYPCATCHQPVAGDAIAAHLDGDPAIALPGYAAGTCADDACHGGGAPRWGAPDSVSGCDACHGLPPPDHSVGACGDCHPGADDARHVDGVVDLTPTDDCMACHGEPASGAHRAHADPIFSAPVPCAGCHVVPEAADAPGHFGPPPAEVALAAGRYEDRRCADTACHAGPGAATPAPVWDAPGFVCGDCHGTPPPDHLPGACGLCHPAVAEGDVIRDPARHADGRVDFR